MMRAYELMVIIDGDLEDAEGPGLGEVGHRRRSPPPVARSTASPTGGASASSPTRSTRRSTATTSSSRLLAAGWRPRRARAHAPPRGRHRPPQAASACPTPRPRAAAWRAPPPDAARPPTKEDHPWQTTPSPSSATSPAIPSCASPPAGAGVASFGIAVNRRYQVERRVAGADVVLQRRRLGHARRERRGLAHTRAPASSSPAASSSARARPRTARSAPSSRSSPTRSARACAGRRPRSSAPPAPAPTAAGGRRRRRRRGAAGGGGRAPDPIYGDEEPF